MSDSEAKAWRWLLALPRISWEERGWHTAKQQVLVRMIPGSLGAGRGEPGVEVLLSHPDTWKRVKGTGNSLMQAAKNAHESLWGEGVRLRGPDWPEKHGVSITAPVSEELFRATAPEDR